MRAIGPAEVQQAFDSAVAGDLDPLVSMLGPDLQWRGVQRGHWFWRKAPS